MDELSLPIIKGETRSPKILSMDEYLAFVEFNLKNTFDKEAYKQWKKMLAVDVKFVL